MDALTPATATAFPRICLGRSIHVTAIWATSAMPFSTIAKVGRDLVGEGSTRLPDFAEKWQFVPHLITHGTGKFHCLCADIDECEDPNIYCSSRCVNRPGGFVCKGRPKVAQFTAMGNDVEFYARFQNHS